MDLVRQFLDLTLSTRVCSLLSVQSLNRLFGTRCLYYKLADSVVLDSTGIFSIDFILSHNLRSYSQWQPIQEPNSSSILRQHVLLNQHLRNSMVCSTVIKEIVVVSSRLRLECFEELDQELLLIAVVLLILLEYSFLKSWIVLPFLFLEHLDYISDTSFVIPQQLYSLLFFDKPISFAQFVISLQEFGHISPSEERNS